MRFEDRTQIREGRLLDPGEGLDIPKAVRAQVHGVFELESPPFAKNDPDLPRYAETTVDLVELDPEPKRVPPSRSSAIASARAGLWPCSGWEPGSSNGNGRSLAQVNVVRDDVRFPFAELFALRAKHRPGANAWLDRIAKSDEEALELLPEHWRLIARQLKGRS
jgi:hypothetical protein